MFYYTGLTNQVSEVHESADKQEHSGVVWCRHSPGLSKWGSAGRAAVPSQQHPLHRADTHRKPQLVQQDTRLLDPKCAV